MHARAEGRVDAPIQRVRVNCGANLMRQHQSPHTWRSWPQQHTTAIAIVTGGLIIRPQLRQIVQQVR